MPSDEAIATPDDAALASPASRFAAERRLVVTLWVTYGAFYLCRANIAAAVPGMQTELGLSKTQVGFVLGGLKLAYAIGQLVNGQLAERVRPRTLLAIGMLGSAALNVLFGFGDALGFLVLVWAMNGYAQALGWTPCMRLAHDGIAPERRGRMLGVLGTSYQVGASVAFVLSGWAAERFGFRGALWVPSGLLAAAGLYTLVALRDPPGARPTERGVARRSERPWLETVRLTLGNPNLWFLALALAFLNASRFGFLDWGVSYLKEVQGTGIGKAALNCAILPIGGVAGALVTGWVTDRKLGGRRAPAICVLLVALGLLTLAYDHVARASFAGTLALLVVVGFCIFGPQVLLVGTAPADLARGGTAAAAAGFVDFMGYVGAFAGDQVTGFVVDRAHGHGWRLAILVWAGWAFAAALMAGLLWARTARAPSSPARA